MPTLLYSIGAAALLSFTSLLAVLFRVSPLTSPGQALPTFFASLFLTVASVMTLLLFMLWKWWPFHTWNDGSMLSISIRQGLFIAAAVVILLLFHLLGILTWWIGALIIAVFLIIEIALHL